METLTSIRKKQFLPEKVSRSDEEVYAYWESILTKEPISDGLRALVRADLKKKWYSERSYLFRQNTRICWVTVDSYKILLEDTIGNLAPAKLKYMCNKPTAFYFLQSAQSIDRYGERTLMPGIVYAMICGEWFQTGSIASQASSSAISLRTR